MAGEVQDGAGMGKGRRRRIVPLVWLGGAGAAVVLAAGIGGSLSGFSASITSSNNTASTGTLTMSETGVSGVGGTSTCSSPSTTCVLDKFGGQANMIPDTTVLTGSVGSGTIPTDGDVNQNVGVVKITNTGTVKASALTLTGGTCSSALCPLLDVAVYNSTAAPTAGTQSTYGTQVFYGSAATLAATATSPLTAAASVAGAQSDYLTFVVWVDGSATNSAQGLTATEPITWTLVQ